jgi:hypothetical protein
MMYLALSYDHRIVDGKGAVSFLKRVKEYLEEPEEMLLEGQSPAVSILLSALLPCSCSMFKLLLPIKAPPRPPGLRAEAFGEGVRG